MLLHKIRTRNLYFVYLCSIDCAKPRVSQRRKDTPTYKIELRILSNSAMFTFRYADVFEIALDSSRGATFGLKNDEEAP